MIILLSWTSSNGEIYWTRVECGALQVFLNLREKKIWNSSPIVPLSRRRLGEIYDHECLSLWKFHSDKIASYFSSCFSRYRFISFFIFLQNWFYSHLPFQVSFCLIAMKTQTSARQPTISVALNACVSLNFKAAALSALKVNIVCTK